MNKYYVMPADIIESNFPEDDLSKFHVIYMKEDDNEQEPEFTAFGFNTEDIMSRAGDDGYTITEADATEILKMMLHSADMNVGISWDTVSSTIGKYCQKNNIEPSEDEV